MAVVRLPSLLAQQAGGRKQFEIQAGTLAQALRELPISDLIFAEDGSLRPLVNVFVDGRDVRDLDGLATELRGDEDVRVVAAIAGG